MASVRKIRDLLRDMAFLQKFLTLGIMRESLPQEILIVGLIREKLDYALFGFGDSFKIASSPLLFLLHVTTRRYTCMKRTPVQLHAAT